MTKIIFVFDISLFSSNVATRKRADFRASHSNIINLDVNMRKMACSSFYQFLFSFFVVFIVLLNRARSLDNGLALTPPS